MQPLSLKLYLTLKFSLNKQLFYKLLIIFLRILIIDDENEKNDNVNNSKFGFEIFLLSSYI